MNKTMLNLENLLKSTAQVFWLFRNCRGFVSIAGPRPSLHRIRRLSLGPTIEHTTALPEDPSFSL